MAEQGSLAVLGADSPSSAELYTPKRSVSRPGITKHVRTIGAEIRNLNEPVRRLIISKVVLKNFKSYGGTTVIGPFHKRFTAIVGPNGSGKSNVIDAMLFVFGFRAKQMRFDKLSELIHNSNAYIQLNKGRPLESMEVAIHFCEILDRDPDVDEFEVIPGSELVISREVNRDNSSKYRINGSPASQKQVSNALKAFGMDLYNNRFLILQGEVEQISQMKPKATKPDEEGLLEYLEDIIGTNQYLEKIKEAQLQCEELQDQYRERGNLTRVFQKEVEDLLESKQECDTYLLKEKDLLYNKVLISKLEIATAKHSREAMTAKLEMLENEYQESTAHFGAVEKDRDEALKGVKEIESELDSSLKSQKRLSESLQKMITRDEDLRKQLLREVKKVEEKTAGIKKATSNRPRHEAESKEKIRRSEEMLKAIPSLQDELEKAEKTFEELTVKMKPELSAANMELAKHEAMLAPLQQSYDKVNKDVNVLESSIELLNTNRKDIETEVESMRTRETKLEESIQQNKAKLKKQEETMKKQSGEFESNAKKAKELDATVRSRSQVYLKKKGEYESLKREFNESTGSKEQYRHVMGLVSSGKIRGVHGRLGDLGSIDPKYEKAFMAAAGGQVDVLIVDTPDVASQIFDELRRQNMGRSSAMALSVLNNDLKHHMDAFERAKHEGLPEGVQYLLNLTEPIRPMYKICFYYALRDTLLAENLNDATRVGYKHRRRVVTLDGEVIEPDGRMSGGGVQSKKGSGINTKRMDMPSKGPLDMKQLEALRKEIETEGHELEKLKGELVMLNQSQTLIGKEMGELKYSIDLLRQTVANEEIQLSELSQSAKNLVGSSQLGEIENKLKLLQEHLVEKKKEQSAAASKVKAQEKIVAAAYKDVDNVGKGQLKIAKDRVSEIERKLSDTRGVIERLRKEAANLQADSEKCARDVSKLTKEIEQHKSKEQQLEQQLNHLEEEAAVVSNDMNEVNEKVEQQKAKLKELRTVVTEKTKILNEHEMKAVDMKHNIEGLSKKLKQAEERDGVHRARLKDSIEQYKKTCKMIRSSQESQKLLNSVSDRKGSILIIEDDEETMPQDGTEEVDTRKEPEEDLEMLPEEELQKLDMERLTSQLDKLKNNMGPTPNLAVLDQFRLKVEEYNHKRKELFSLQNSLETAKRSFEQLCLKRKSEFLTNFAIIASKLKEIYQAITLGGDAELELVDSTDPFTEGILFSVRPAKKSWKQIQNLSGGEKTLSSLALVFALHHYKPNPVYFMDEIDAALDFRNVSIIAQSIKERTKDAQFIIISLRNQMFELCNQMVGIYKTMDVTKSVCINPASFDVRKRKPAEEDSTMTQEA